MLNGCDVVVVMDRYLMVLSESGRNCGVFAWWTENT